MQGTGSAHPNRGERWPRRAERSRADRRHSGNCLRGGLRHDRRTARCPCRVPSRTDRRDGLRDRRLRHRDAGDIGDTPTSARWQEPASYSYTLGSSGGERGLLGTFRITVRDGAVAEAVGLDDSSRRVVEDIPDAVPTIGALLDELDQARRDDADTAEAQYAADGHPVRISLDWEENAIDDEALYLISAYAPADGRRVSR
ncbi:MULTISPECIES: DUF6174 domain-containing protein [unclassified Streptomyces]|uniref:DUF6174 domain-containing protein n=1 Tax=unclassified Streptomyces TaxID=2593676 RepID=UPI002366EB7B|nr:MULTISPECIES: DUF6174 domain-containing protein [unclassified Streptomyces]MDF3145656.1 DUF6174 domain-containing protein [Streptomyces sp. T21Q-yed]WDF41979.1 DUF6174 domain-containing protein [Streptomyces sp. T12]